MTDDYLKRKKPYDQKSITCTNSIISKMIRATPGLQSFVLYILNAFCPVIKGLASLSQVDGGSLSSSPFVVDVAKNHIPESYRHNEKRFLTKS